MKLHCALPRSTPEAQGIASSAIAGFLDAVRDRGFEVHGFMLLRRGQVAAEGWSPPYGPEHPHELYSMSKSFAATAIGIAEAEGLLTLNDKVVDFFEDERPETISPNLAAMTIRHLLMMGTGQTEAIDDWTPGEDGWVRRFLAAPVPNVPGTHFFYNTPATYMLSAILQRVAGQTLHDYLVPRLFAPLGMTGTSWKTCPHGVTVGGSGLRLTTEAIAKFGQLYLQGGEWEGRRLLTEAWVREATRFHIANGSEPDNDWTQGYGYQFWRCRHGAYRADGAFGQMCVVMPEQEAVLVLTSGSEDKHGLLNTVWETLLPAFSPDALAADEQGNTALAERLRAFRFDEPQAETASPIEAVIQDRTYRMEPGHLQIESIAWRFEDRHAICVLRNVFGEQRIRLGRGSWQPSRVRFAAWSLESEQPVEGSFSWQDPHTLEFRLLFVETAFAYRFVCRLDDPLLSLEVTSNVCLEWEPCHVAIRGERLVTA